MTVIDAVSFGVSATASATQNGNNLLAAIAAAANAQTRLILPAGDIQFDQDLVLPAGFVGVGGISGLGDFITRLVPVGGCNGLMLDLSAGNAASNKFDVSDLGLVASAGVAGTPLKISYGTKSLGSVENQPGSRIRRVAIYGGGWVNGIVLQECWHALLEAIYLYGSSATYAKGSSLGKGDGGPGTGVALSLMSGVNNFLRDITTEFFSQGIITNANGRGTSGDCQGIYVDGLHMVECIEGVHAYGTPGGNLSTLILDNWMVDNGNLNLPNHRSIVIDNGEDCEIGFGQGLQDGGDSQIIFNSCRACHISDDVSLENRANTTGPVIQDNNGNGNRLGSSAPRLLNISTRGFVGTGANVMIGGFVIGGSASKTVLVRAAGPALTQFGVPGVLPDPKLTLMQGSAILASQGPWGGSAQVSAAAAQVGAFPWPAGSKDSAILATLQPGNYTVQVAGASGDTGDALLEVYDAS